MSKRRKKPTLTVAEMRRTLRAAFAEGCDEVEMVPTADGIKAVCVIKPRGEREEGDEKLEGLE
ncbi:MAG: hypothetical protein HOP13_20695 [Alphaproteobacteria bacterium]|nr:hypothetical protein [Alphaproteobacteria bacterium]